MRIFIIFTVFFIITGCSTTIPQNPNNGYLVKKSLYLNKELIKFEIDNGYCKSRKAMPDGGYINYYISDSGNIIANMLDWDSYPPCKLAIKTDKDGIIKEIRVIEDDIKCAYI